MKLVKLFQIIFRESNSVLSFLVSAMFHLLLFLIAYYFTELHIKKADLSSGYVQVFTKKGEAGPINFEKNVKAQEDESNKKSSEVLEQEEISPAAVNLNFIDENADTTILLQTYSESTLNVSVKYPVGWTFIDQNVDKKLDGVTFWANDSRFNPPPYVHLEVCDKDLFNPSKYKHNLQRRDAVIYFNDPENLANYFSQSFYFRTETSEDYNIKLTIRGEEAFKSFQPFFYGILKSFRFGKNIF